MLSTQDVSANMSINGAEYKDSQIAIAASIFIRRHRQVQKWAAHRDVSLHGQVRNLIDVDRSGHPRANQLAPDGHELVNPCVIGSDALIRVVAHHVDPSR
jgi:hypothetical protein